MAMVSLLLKLGKLTTTLLHKSCIIEVTDMTPAFQ